MAIDPAPAAPSFWKIVGQYAIARAQEGSTQLALAADIFALQSAVDGTISWKTFAHIAIGSLVPILFRSTSARPS